MMHITRKQLINMIEQASAIMDNVNGGDTGRESAEWLSAYCRWKDEFFNLLSSEYPVNYLRDRPISINVKTGGIK